MARPSLARAEDRDGATMHGFGGYALPRGEHADAHGPMFGVRVGISLERWLYLGLVAADHVGAPRPGTPRSSFSRLGGELGVDWRTDQLILRPSLQVGITQRKVDASEETLPFVTLGSSLLFRVTTPLTFGFDVRAFGIARRPESWTTLASIVVGIDT